MGAENGAAIRLTAGTLQLEQMRIGLNLVELGCGAAVFVAADATLLVDESEIAGNNSMAEGGAICSHGGTVELNNVDMHHNNATESGGAI